MKWHRRDILRSSISVFISDVFASSSAFADTGFLNVSYDPTRELYKVVDATFAEIWRKKSGNFVTIRTTNGGSRAQMQSVVDGAPADVVTLACAGDIDFISRITGKIDKDWRNKFPNHSIPYSSPIVFLTRHGNPKNIRNWGDLTQSGISIITANPKTSGGARYNFLAALGYALHTYNKDEKKSVEFIKSISRNVVKRASGARGASVLFLQRQFGDVMITYESEALLALAEFGSDSFDIVYPDFILSAEFPVAIVDTNAAKNGNTNMARDYLNFLFEKKGQEIIAQNFFRPAFSELVAEDKLHQFRKINTTSVESIFGSWEFAQAKYFSDGGMWDQIQRSLAN